MISAPFVFWVQSGLNAIIAGTERNDLADLRQASTTFLLPLNKRFVGCIERFFRIFATFNDLAITQVSFNVARQDEGINAHLAKCVRTGIAPLGDYRVSSNMPIGR